MERETQRAPERPYSVLIADHSPAVRKNLAALAADLALEVVGLVDEGGEAAALSWLHRPDLVLFDIGMPGKDGLEALAEIREQSPRSRVLVLTSASERDRVLACRRLGVADYVLKPYRRDDLKARLERALGGTGAEGLPREERDAESRADSFLGRIRNEARADRALFFQAEDRLSQADIEELFHGAAVG